MIAYYLGIPGSGKTYFGVNVIYDNFAKDIPKKTKLSLKKDYENCYTNINEFNFDLVNNVFKLDTDELLTNLTILFNMYHGIKAGTKDKTNKATDAQLIEKAKELNIYKTLFVIDECHNFFDTQDKVKVWWLTYHRHLYHDIYLITQSLSLVNTKYKPLAESFYKAKSSSLTLNKKYFNYMYYTESRMSKESYVETKKIVKRQEVFKLYKSGDKVESKNVILKFIMIAFGLFILLMIGAWYFFHTLSSSVEPVSKSKPVINKDKKVTHNPVAPDSKTVNDDFSADNQVFLLLKCNYNKCFFNNKSYDSKLLKFAQAHFNLKIIHRKVFFNMNYFSVAVDRSFLKFINGGSNNVQDTASNITLFPTSSN